jgi:predicted phage terminase large subunit-like protein
MRSSSQVLEELKEPWKYLPHTYAEYLSKGKWQCFDYLYLLSHVVTAAIARGGGRILVEIPPRHGKSFFISKWTPAWFLENWPDQRVILTTYEANFAAKWGRQVRNIVSSRIACAEDSTAAARWATAEGGGMITAGVGGPITGEGGDLLIIDDPHKNWQEAMSSTIRQGIIDWFNSTFYTRAEPGATIVVLHTRWHERDLIGYLLKEHEDNWVNIRFPAIAEDNDVLGRRPGDALCPERYDEKALDRIRKGVGSMVWAGLYQQRPAPAEGNIFKRQWFRYYKQPPRGMFIIQSWDTGYKKGKHSAFTVCQTWGAGQDGLYLLDQWRERVEYPELEKQVGLLYMKWSPSAVLIEDKASGQSLIQSYQRKTSLPIIPIEPLADKVVRAMAVSPFFEAGRIVIPEPSPLTRWVSDYVETLATFPNTEFLDEVDATSQAVTWLQSFSDNTRIVTGMERKAIGMFNGFRIR